ncbi:Hypothetical predicted protein [Paramuricea clavata]|uniref:Uncharacterized protein n=1 Tax=Paramuricea clavata TaxID=317549 RepID=A0A6S7HJG5_PARCT|nr:Hypothetical predicted protein [Paramuricea clavata]
MAKVDTLGQLKKVAGTKLNVEDEGVNPEMKIFNKDGGEVKNEDMALLNEYGTNGSATKLCSASRPSRCSKYGVSQDQTGTQNQTPGVSYDEMGSKQLSNPTVSYDRSGAATKRGHTPVIRLDDDDDYVHVPAKRVRSSDDVNFDDDVNDELEELETENILSPNSRWEASATLLQFLETAVKRLNIFERKTLVKTYTRPNVDAVYTPTMDEYLKPFIYGVATPDKPHKDLQDSVLDVFGPLCTAYENLLSMESTMTYDGWLNWMLLVFVASRIVSNMHCC